MKFSISINKSQRKAPKNARIGVSRLGIMVYEHVLACQHPKFFNTTTLDFLLIFLGVYKRTFLRNESRAAALQPSAPSSDLGCQYDICPFLRVVIASILNPEEMDIRNFAFDGR